MRTLLLSLFLVVASIAFGQSWPAITSQTKPWTRWWWMGSAVDKAGLSWNMEAYRAAGLGGLELTPIYGVKGYEDRFVSYLSPAWMDLLSYTLGEARRLDLGLDMSTGTGWPFGGGPLIDSVYACKELFSKTWTVSAGGMLADSVVFWQEPLVRTDGRSVRIDELKEPIFSNKDLQALALFQIRFSRRLALQTLMGYSSKGAIVDLTARVDASGRLSWTAPRESGDWTLYGLFQGWHGKMVERAAPGAEGNVIDHFSKSALSRYLQRFDSASLTGLRCFFNDSYEVDDARGQSNWTPGFLDSFRVRRGYDLRSYLPALFGKDSLELDQRVRCDFRETISDLLLDNFTLPWRSWASLKGSGVRNQAHGSPANILDLYAASDIPETEGSEVLRNKMASSAAHVMGKRLASAESVTWLGEHFLSSLSDIKQAVDGYFTGGVNHIFYHGTAYTPKEAAWPGWLFYASVHFTPNDPSWANFSVLNQYVARCQSFLQQGEPDNDVLLYYPIYDSWMEQGTVLLKHYDNPKPEFNGSGFLEAAERMWGDGYAFDYVSDKQLEGCKAEGGFVRTSGGARYRTVLVAGSRYMSVAAMAALRRLAAGGAKIVFWRSLPMGAPGLKGGAFERDSRFVVGNELDGLLKGAGVREETMTTDSLEFVRRTYGDGHVYFIVNHSSRGYTGYLSLSVSFRSAAIFDPMTGRSGLARSRGGAVYVQLEPGESCLIQTTDSLWKGAGYAYYKSGADSLVLGGPWTIRFLSGGPVLPAGGQLAGLGSWTGMEGEAVKSFSGSASYTTSFARPKGSSKRWLLDLGKVDETAQVFLNGKELARLIGPRFGVVVPAEKLLAQNTLVVIVSSNMVNRIEDMDRKGIVYKKFYNTNFPAHEKVNRGTDGLFNASKWRPVDGGLSGPVRLVSLEDIL